jgi:hypothetical protein
VLIGKAHCHDAKPSCSSTDLVLHDELAAVNVPKFEGGKVRCLFLGTDSYLDIRKAHQQGFKLLFNIHAFFGLFPDRTGRSVSIFSIRSISSDSLAKKSESTPFLPIFRQTNKIVEPTEYLLQP